MTRPFFSVIIVAFESADYLSRCLAHLEAQTFTDFEVILVDNGPEPHSVSASPGRGLRVLGPDGNHGFAAGNNIGAAAARGDWLALLNPDAFPAPDWLEQLHAAALTHGPEVVLTSLQIRDADPEVLDGAGDAYAAFGFPYRAYYGAPHRQLEDAWVFSPCGAAMAVERRAFQFVGGFDEAFFCYCEDVDFGFRWRRAGGACRLIAAAKVSHIGSAATGLKSAFSVYHGFRNRLWTYVKNMPASWLLLSLPVHVVATAAALRGAFKAGQGGAAVRGLLDGVCGLWGVLKRRKPAKASGLSVIKAMTFDGRKIQSRLP